MSWLEEVAAAYGTPTYVYDLVAVREAYARLTASLPAPSTLYYSLKANPHPKLVAELCGSGCGAEVSSAGELAVALAAGCDPSRVLLTGPGKAPADLRAAIAAGVWTVSVESPTDLRRVSRAALDRGATVRCLLRVNADQHVPGLGLSMTGVASQFGADASWVLARPEEFAAPAAVDLVGVHLYMGTNVETEPALLRQYEVGLDLARAVERALRTRLRVIDLGGGFAAPYAQPGPAYRYPGMRDKLAGLLDRAFPGWRGGEPEVVFESGRHLVGAAGWLLTSVLDVKRSKGSTFVVLDSGIHHLGGMAGLRRLPPVRVRPVTADGRPTVADTWLTGPLCTPLDCWARQVELPRLAAGDLLAVPNVGAYGLTASLLAFLSHPPPTEVVLDRGAVVAADRLELSRRPVPPPTVAPTVAPTEEVSTWSIQP